MGAGPDLNVGLSGATYTEYGIDFTGRLDLVI
jgi:hypothetical protein